MDADNSDTASPERAAAKAAASQQAPSSRAIASPPKARPQTAAQFTPVPMLIQKLQDDIRKHELRGEVLCRSGYAHLRVDLASADARPAQGADGWLAVRRPLLLPDVLLGDASEAVIRAVAMLELHRYSWDAAPLSVVGLYINDVNICKSSELPLPLTAVLLPGGGHTGLLLLSRQPFDGAQSHELVLEHRYRRYNTAEELMHEAIFASEAPDALMSAAKSSSGLFEAVYREYVHTTKHQDRCIASRKAVEDVAARHMAWARSRREGRVSPHALDLTLYVRAGPDGKLPGAALDLFFSVTVHEIRVRQVERATLAASK